MHCSSIYSKSKFCSDVATADGICCARVCNLICLAAELDVLLAGLCRPAEHRIQLLCQLHSPVPGGHPTDGILLPQ